MSVTGPEDGEPYRAGIAMADLAAGMFAASAILAALYARRGTGQGQRIDISLLDSQVALLSYVASNYLVSGEPPRRYGNGHPNIVPYQSFRARDGFFAFAAGNDGQWRKFCQAVDRTGWADDPRFATNGDRVRHRGELVPLLSELFATRAARAWIDLCESIGIPAAPINTVDKVFQRSSRIHKCRRAGCGHRPSIRFRGRCRWSLRRSAFRPRRFRFATRRRTWGSTPTRSSPVGWAARVRRSPLGARPE